MRSAVGSVSRWRHGIETTWLSGILNHGTNELVCVHLAEDGMGPNLRLSSGTTEQIIQVYVHGVTDGSTALQGIHRLVGGGTTLLLCVGLGPRDVRAGTTPCMHVWWCPVTRRTCHRSEHFSCP